MELALLAISIAILLMTLVIYGNLTARIRGIERKLNALLRHHGVDPTLGLGLSDRVKELAVDPVRKIEAIKLTATKQVPDLLKPRKRLSCLSIASSRRA
jgi:hypothetical protein